MQDWRNAQALSVGTLVIMMSTASPAGSGQAPFYTDKDQLMVYRNAAGTEHDITTAAAWQKRRAHILSNMHEVMGDMPADTQRVPLDIQVLEETSNDTWMRRKILFTPEPGDAVPAYLFLPLRRTGKVPAVLCLHQTTTVGKGEPAGFSPKTNLHYARELAERGYVTLAPDYPNFGDYRFDPYANGYISASMKGIWNHRRALDLLQAMPEVQSDRLGCIGHSLGGHNTLFLAAFDTRVKVAVTSCGFTSFRKYMKGDLTGWSHRGYMPRIASEYDKNPAKMPFDFSEVLAAIAPRAVFVNAPVSDGNFDLAGVKDCLTAARLVFRLHSAENRLRAEHPDCGHDFPPAVREHAYAFIDEVLRAEPAAAEE